MRIRLILVAYHVLLAVARRPAPRDYAGFDYFLLEHVPGPDSSDILETADVLGLELVEQVGELADHWLLRSPKSRPDRVAEKLAHVRARAAHPLAPRDAARISNAVRALDKQVPRMLHKRAPPPPSASPPPPLSPGAAIAARLQIRDPLFEDQWHIVNDAFPENSLNVTGVWEAGVTGKGVTVAIVDDGLDYTSRDLADNFDAEGSYDFNDHQALPEPKLFDDYHGTRCAGEIAAVKNDVCGVGVAYDAKVAGIRILSGAVTDADEAASLNYGYQSTAIYSCSWGPSDNGRSVGAPSTLVEKAMVNGVQKGRSGKGSIFVFASGNGGGRGDQCNFDGYTNSIFSITVGAVTYNNQHPPYSEACAANLVVTYSSGPERRISTTDKGESKCTDNHSGTSAAAPLAAGVFALALQVRPDLTWRDMQHLCVRTARTFSHDDPDWTLTAAGRRFSYKYGYGILDGWRLVEAARQWKLVAPQTWLDVPVVKFGDAYVDERGMHGGEAIVTGGIQHSTFVSQDMVSKGNLASLEHITVRVWIAHNKRGAITVELISPQGIRSLLAAAREGDTSHKGLHGWQFMTVKHWDESPVGNWTISVGSSEEGDDMNGSFLGWSMTLWGSARDASQAVHWSVPDPARLQEPFAQTAHPPVATSTRSFERPVVGGTETTTLLQTSLPTTAADSVVTITQTRSRTPVVAIASATNVSTSPAASSDWLKSHPLLGGAIGLLFLLGFAAAGAFMAWRRHKVHPDYRTVAGDDDAGMALIGRPLRSVSAGSDFESDSEAEEDDQTPLRRGAS